MDSNKRKPFQGVSNIVRFNWHFYLIAIVLIAGWFLVRGRLPEQLAMVGTIVLVLVVLSLGISLVVSWYVYDRSDLYGLHWINQLHVMPGARLLNINAGFDETSQLLARKYPGSSLKVLDFYDPAKHTEVSIKRARRAYAVYPGTMAVAIADMSLGKGSADYIFTLLAAHEIRERDERISFFSQLKDGLSDHGKIVVAEHLRDLPNFLAYTVGFFHFLSRQEWLATFEGAGLRIEKEIEITPFTRGFILERNGSTH
jgi:hypothetical protein